MNFSFDHYKRTLGKSIELGYEFLCLKDYESVDHHEKLIMMRHDVDYSPKNALKMAEIENGLGINSSFFIRIHAGFYNALELKTYKIIQEIKNLGHEIGFHQEPDFSSLSPKDPDEYLVGEINSFNSLFNVKISGISTHEPARRGIQVTEENIHKFPIQYASEFPVFTKKMKYISDSGCRWREGCMSEWIKRGEPKLHICTHPFWWFKESPLENY